MKNGVKQKSVFLVKTVSGKYPQKTDQKFGRYDVKSAKFIKMRKYKFVQIFMPKIQKAPASRRDAGALNESFLRWDYA